MCPENPLFRQEVSIFAVLRRAFVKSFSALCAPNFVCGTNLQFSALFAISCAACSSKLICYGVCMHVYARIYVCVRMRVYMRVCVCARARVHLYIRA